MLLKAVNRGDKRTRRVRDRDFVKFERSCRYRDRYRCQEKKSRRGHARNLVFRDPPTPRTRARSLFAARDSPPWNKEQQVGRAVGKDSSSRAFKEAAE